MLIVNDTTFWNKKLHGFGVQIQMNHTKNVCRVSLVKEANVTSFVYLNALNLFIGTHFSEIIFYFREREGRGFDRNQEQISQEK